MSRMLAGLAVVAAGCSTGPGRSDASLRDAMARWDAAQVSSYEIVVERLCFCPTVEPVRVEVANGQIVARTFVATGQPVPANLASLYPDVAGLFSLVADAYRNADAISATFDGQYGFPASAVIDYVAQAVDDELTIRTSAFARH